MSNPSRARLWGWGHTNPTMADELAVDRAGVPAALKEAGERGTLARGLGRSYGDAAQNGGGLVLRLTSDPSEIVLDPSTGFVTVGAGVSIDELLRVVVPRGFFIPVTPGTRFVTIGGAIASDIHGKNHHVDGSIGDHVESITMVLADGTTKAI
ncbi:MAG: FAD-binding oxidoreductase, partial [Ilumatobacteraceae bacterium]